MSEFEAVCNPDWVERIHAWGVWRFESRRWEQEPAESSYMRRFYQWHLLLEATGVDGIDLRDVALNDSRRGTPDWALLLAAVRPLLRRGLLQRDGWQILPVPHHDDYWNTAARLWLWLSRRTPDGYPPAAK